MKDRSGYEKASSQYVSFQSKSLNDTFCKNKTLFSLKNNNILKNIIKQGTPIKLQLSLTNYSRIVKKARANDIFFLLKTRPQAR